MQYYGAFYHSALYPFLRRINAYLVRWTRKKYKRLRSFHKVLACWQRITRQSPRLFATGLGSLLPGDQDDKSRMTGDCHVRICEGRRVKLPPATRPKN